jgi:uncharacterized protein (TIGR02246 family)
LWTVFVRIDDVLSAVVIGLLLQTSTPAPDHEIREVVSAIIAADNAGDLERVVELYSASAILMPPDGEPIEGREAIRAHYRRIFSRFTLEATLDSDETVVCGDWAFDRGRTHVRSKSKETGDTNEAHDKYVMILHRDATGWQIARLIWNRNPSPD